MRRPVRIAAPIAVFILILFFFLAHPHIGGVLPTIPLSHREAINQKHTFISHGDDGLFDPPEASIQHNAIRGDNVAWTMDGSTTWHSVSRPPNRPECWSYDDRFSAYKLPSAAMQTIISTNNQRTKNSTRAIVLRLGPKHAWGPQFTYHARALVMEAGYLAGYSVFILTHLDGNTASPASAAAAAEAWLDRVPSDLRPLVQIFSTADLRAWLPKNSPFKDTLEHNHVPIQMFMSRNPQYEFAYTVESDVRLVGRWDVFLGDVDREYAVHRARRDADQNMPAVPDLLTFQVVNRPRSSWVWLEGSCVSRFGGLENVRSSLGVVWGWSRRLTDTMTRYNAEGVNCYYEYFAPSVAFKEDLTTFFYQHPLYCPGRASPIKESLAREELGRNDPRMVQLGKIATGCTYFYDKKYSQRFWQEWFDDPGTCRPPALVHPVKGDFFN